MVMMGVELSRRLGRAFLIGYATPEERSQLVAAARDAHTFADLSSQDQALVIALESRRATRER